MSKPYIICHMMTSLDGRAGMPTVFDGFGMEHEVTPLSLIDVTKFDSGALWIRYKTNN